jgi:hypothetical protein
MSPETMRRFAPGAYDPGKDVWELYYLPDDFSQAHDLAADHPGKLAELQELWWAEAERNRALPLLGGFSVFSASCSRCPPSPGGRSPVMSIASSATWCRASSGRSYAIEAEFDVPEAGAEGVLVANADFIGGFGLWVDGAGMLNHTYSFLGVETYRQTSTEKIPAGAVTVKMLFEATRPSRAPAGP